MLEWLEKGHEAQYFIEKNDEKTMLALRKCGLKKHFLTLGKRAQQELLKHMVRRWNVNE